MSAPESMVRYVEYDSADMSEAEKHLVNGVAALAREHIDNAVARGITPGAASGYALYGIGLGLGMIAGSCAHSLIAYGGEQGGIEAAVDRLIDRILPDIRHRAIETTAMLLEKEPPAADAGEQRVLPSTVH